MQVPGQVQRGSGEGSEGSGEGLGGFGAEPGQVQQGSGEGSGEGLGGFGAEPGQVQQGSGEGSGEVQEALVQSQVRFNGFRRSLASVYKSKTHGTTGSGLFDAFWSS